MLKLSLPGEADLDLDDYSNGLVVNQWDPGYPEIRQVVENATDRDGTVDMTTWMGARVVSIQAQVALAPGQSRDQVLSRLRQFLSPAQRPILTWRDESDPGSIERQITLRADSHSAPLIIPGRSAVAVSWRCPDPRWYSTVVNSVNINLSGTQIGGRTYNLTFPRHYPLSTGGTGTGIVTNGGNLPTPPILKFFPTCTNPSLIKVATGEQIRFLTTINPPDYLEVDMGAHTVYLNSDPNADRYNLLDFQTSTWWQLDPGDNVLRYTADSISGFAQVQVLWQDATL
jgi:hypothetical protein